MSVARRLLSLCLLLVFASYGAVAAAAAHSHHSHDAQLGALHAVASDVGETAIEPHGHHGVEADGDHDSDSSEADKGSVSAGFHVHSVAAFTTVDDPIKVLEPVVVGFMIWVQPSADDVAGLFSPLRKPPRTHL